MRQGMREIVGVLKLPGSWWEAQLSCGHHAGHTHAGWQIVTGKFTFCWRCEWERRDQQARAAAQEPAA